MRAVILAVVAVAAIGCSDSFNGPTGPVRRLAGFVRDAPFELGSADANGIYPIVVQEADKSRYSKVFSSFDTVVNGEAYSRGQLYDALPEQLLRDLPIVDIRSIALSDTGVVTMAFVRPDIPRFRERLNDLLVHAPAPRATPSKKDQEGLQYLLSTVRRELLTVDTIYFSLDSNSRIVGYRTSQQIRDSIRQDSLARATLSAFESWLGRAFPRSLEVKDWSAPLPLQIPSVFVDWDMVAPGADSPTIEYGSGVWVGGDCFGVRGSDTTFGDAHSLTLKERNTHGESKGFSCTWISDETVAGWRRVRPTDLWAQISVGIIGRGTTFDRLVHIGSSPGSRTARR